MRGSCASTRRHPRPWTTCADGGSAARWPPTSGLDMPRRGGTTCCKALGGSDHRIRLLRDAGLITEQDGKRYDRLRDRIIFPIRDTRGRVVGFGGRLLGDGKPKYLNSPETPVFHKGRELYGLYEARQADGHPPRLLVVEGYMDVVALAQFGISNAVATLGTATTSDHLEKLYRATPELVFCFDGDRAGRDAAWKALNTALPLMRDGRQARFLFLPDGEDPDSLVRRIGAEAMQAEIGHALPLSEFLFDKLASQVDMESLDGRARLGELAKPLLERLPAGMFRDMMDQALHERIGLRQPPAASQAARQPAPRPRIRRPQGSIPPIRRAVALLVQYPELAQLELPGGWESLDSPGIGLLQELITAARAQPPSAARHWSSAGKTRPPASTWPNSPCSTWASSKTPPSSFSAPFALWPRTSVGPNARPCLRKAAARRSPKKKNNDLGNFTARRRPNYLKTIDWRKPTSTAIMPDSIFHPHAARPARRGDVCAEHRGSRWAAKSSNPASKT